MWYGNNEGKWEVTLVEISYVDTIQTLKNDEIEVWKDEETTKLKTYTLFMDMPDNGQ